jgi:hypothetical protein
MINSIQEMFCRRPLSPSDYASDCAVGRGANEEVSMRKKRKSVIDPSTHIATAFVQVSLFSSYSSTTH